MSFSADTALQLLKDGNYRYLSGNPVNPVAESPNHIITAAGQKPFAVVVTCSDSRLSPEIIFDTDHGHLFVVRTAGNVVSEYDLASIEFAVNALGVNLIIVMGHDECGAVAAAVMKDGEATSPPFRYLPQLVGHIRDNLNGTVSPGHYPTDNPQDISPAIDKNTCVVASTVTRIKSNLAVSIVPCRYRFNGEVLFGISE